MSLSDQSTNGSAVAGGVGAGLLALLGAMGDDVGRLAARPLAGAGRAAAISADDAGAFLVHAGDDLLARSGPSAPHSAPHLAPRELPPFRLVPHAADEASQSAAAETLRHMLEEAAGRGLEAAAADEE